MDGKLYTVNEIAEILRTTPNTIYRWLRAGKLPGVKIGKEWRIKKETITSMLTENNSIPSTAQDLWDSIDQHHNHVLAVTSNVASLYNLEADFFKKGLNKGYRLFKGCWWQHPDDVREELTVRGLPIEKLENNNSLTIVNLTQQYNRSGVMGPVESWSGEAAKTIALGYQTMWGSGSPHLLSCGGQFTHLIEFERSLHQAISKIPVVGMCPYIFENITDSCFAQMINLINHHKSVVFTNNDTASLLLNELS